MAEDTVIKIIDATVRFNMASERIDNLKEYFVKLAKRQLMFQEFLALQNINFEVRRGESWGIIGTNGSGKSTLLKLICGILKPYSGSVQVFGRIAPLIELGAGFDGELTAKENIFLNGAVLGHTKKYMEEHFEEIVEFAELKDFLDMDSSQIVTMHIQSVDQNRAIKTVKRTITELDRSKIEEVRPDRALCSVA